MKMLLRAFAIFAAVACLFAGAGFAAGSDFVLASGGNAKVAISIPKDAGVSVKYAAGELAKYLGMMSGAKFRVGEDVVGGAVIRVGEAYESEKEDEIRIYLKDGKTLVVTGEGTRGPVYAVYELLERLGCGFWSPRNETVPKKADLSVAGGIDAKEAPDFVVRDPHGESAIYSSEWKAKIRANGVMYAGELKAEQGGARQYDIGEGACGMPDAKEFAAHPEWFAYQKGTKTRAAGQICMTNPGCREEILRRAREVLKAEKGRKQISISIADGGGFCACEGCMKVREREGGVAGPMVEMVNFVAKRLAAEFPGVRVLTLAYNATIRPPKTLKLEENVDIGFAFIERNFARAPSESQGHDKLLGEWAKMSRNNVYVWSYNAPFKDYLVPWPIVDLMGPEMRGYKKYGVKGVYMQMAEGTVADFIDLRCWLCAKLLWKSERDEWGLIEEWCRGACGKGGEKVLAWLKECASLRGAVKGLGVYMNDPRYFMKAGDLLRGDKLLGEAEAAAAGDERALDQIRRIRYSVRHAMLVLYNQEIAAAAKKAGVKIPTRGELLGELIATCKACGNNCWGEGVGWFGNFLPYIRHGETLAEVCGVNTGPRGEWTFWNPVETGKGALEDPFIVYDAATKLYYRVRAAEGTIRVRSAKTAIGLFDEGAQEAVVWTAGGKGANFAGLRGAEMVKAKDGTWWIYATGQEDGLALEGEAFDEVAQNRLFVLKGGKNPMGKFVFKAEILPKLNAADPTVVATKDGKSYLAFVTEAAPFSLRVVELRAPGVVTGKDVAILTTRNSEEAPGSPTFVMAGEELYLLYSVGGRNSSAAEIRALHFKGGNFAAAKSWEKCEKAVIHSGNCFGTESAVLVGPRAPSTFRSSDGSENWIIYRGMKRSEGADAERDAIVSMQRLDDGIDKGTILFGTAAEFAGSKMRVLQPSGDRGRVPHKNKKKK